MAKCIAIEVGDDGAVKVGELPPEAIAQYAQAMQPAKDIESAMAIAGQALGSKEEAGEMGPAMAPNGGQMMGQMSDQDKAWNQVSADRKAMM